MEATSLSSYDDLYQRPAKAPAGVPVEEFKTEEFTRLEDAKPIPDPHQDFDKDRPPQGPAPDPFQEFEVDRKPISKLMEDLPSLDGLFKPFDLTSENPVSDNFDDLYEYSRPTDFVYEDMDLRDPDVVKTLARAEEIFQERAKEAEENAARILETARTEAKGIVAEAETEARARAEAIMDQARQDSEGLASATVADRAEAEEYLAKAKIAETEAEEKLAAVADRIANLDTEKQTMEADLAARQKTMEEEHSRVMAEIEAKRQSIWDEALAKATEEGQSKGLTQGLTEGRNRGYSESSTAFQEKVAGFLPIMEKMENLYNDLWQANGPMMVKLAIEAAEQILNKELREAEDLTVRAFEACIDYLSQANRVVFLARPQDIAALEEAKAEQRQRLGALVTVTFKPEETLGPGDLIMESDVGRLDATVKHRTAQVMEVLREAFSGRDGRVMEPQTEEPPDDKDILDGEILENSDGEAQLEDQPPLETEAAPAAADEAAAEAASPEAAAAETPPAPPAEAPPQDV
ncbi:hypothetical protein C4J81_08790 [Deltaproteobacteria bacterium Smac51]|nr:hypothetical protein C4J81_08790 [Deltaproteobacteria bacterium Smac51]